MGFSEKEPVITGAITPKTTQQISRTLTDEDWRRARGALSVAMDPAGNGQSVEWSNSETKASGSFNPVAVAFASKDGVCRAFIASVKLGDSTEWHQGTACKDDNGAWDVLTSESWKKPQ